MRTQSDQDNGGPRWWRRILEATEVCIAAVAVVTLAVTIQFSRKNQEATGEAQKTASEALQVARDAQKLHESAAEREVAQKFYLGGIPDDLYDDPRIAEMAVINASPVDMYQVAVEGIDTDYYAKEGSLDMDAEETRTVIQLEPFQACTGYTLPNGFDEMEVRVYFFDGSNEWVRHEDGTLEKADGQGSSEYYPGEFLGMDLDPKLPRNPEDPYPFDALGCP